MCVVTVPVRAKKKHILLLCCCALGVPMDKILCSSEMRPVDALLEAPIRMPIGREETPAAAVRLCADGSRNRIAIRAIWSASFGLGSHLKVEYDSLKDSYV